MIGRRQQVFLWAMREVRQELSTGSSYDLDNEGTPTWAHGTIPAPPRNPSNGNSSTTAHPLPPESARLCTLLVNHLIICAVIVLRHGSVL